MYTSTIAKYLTRGGKRKTGGFRRKNFHSVFPFGLARTKIVVEPEVSSLESANFHHFGRFSLWYYMGTEFPKNRARKK
ncbi:hypothetical protein A2721_03420 [Candidatus Gottesmanbacteria bacterium RIFCSPHIGHO2_01_FULL_47_48]|uniref:Uncharacterized protein n=1 Tax=Candidatus Gottesmanbacteria bacterium RIFCSPHIGHO2_01_FULL_47_48 TaxID=1798381 RepID=A0A1F6A2I4_9BACT|nr:MAG: hypothetical protein A2721_03420 [Candidatus Gottesmanbacteria bacterium RIFCSPHIGHO2_01_FULL_47_48]